MKLEIDTGRYDGVVSDNGYENSDTNNDGRALFQYGWQPGASLAPVYGLGNARQRGVAGIGAAALSYTDQEGNIITQDESGNLIAVVGPTAEIYLGSSSTAVIADERGNVIQAGTQSTAYPSKPANMTNAQFTELTSGTSVSGDTIMKAIAALNAFQLSQINIERARSGKQPINTAAYAPSIGVGLTSGTSSMLLYGAIGIGALILFMKK